MHLNVFESIDPPSMGVPFMKRIFGKTVLAAIGLAAAMAAPQAQAGLGDSIFANGGAITIRFEGSMAGFNSTVSVNGGKEIFPNHDPSTKIGDTLNLGDFTADTLIDVMLHVANTGNVFHTGPGTNNIDGLAHALVTVGADGRTFVSFEDMLGGGDRDFNDHMFSLSNVHTVAAVPEPSMVLMMAAGLGILGFLERRRRKDA
jgi:hypothetical protein